MKMYDATIIQTMESVQNSKQASTVICMKAYMNNKCMKICEYFIYEIKYYNMIWEWSYLERVLRRYGGRKRPEGWTEVQKVGRRSAGCHRGDELGTQVPL